MNVRFHSSVLLVNDVKRMADFYRDVLGQKVAFDFGACVIFTCGLSIWKPGPDHLIMQHQQGQPVPTGNPNLELCFETEEFDTAVRELKQHDVKLLHDVTGEQWGQYTIRFFDPENNLVEVGESIPCFVRRMHNEGMTVEEVAERTGVPREAVAGYLDKG